MSDPATQPDPGPGSDGEEDDHGLHAPTNTAAGDRPPGPGSFPNLDAFVGGLLAPAYARDIRNGDTAVRWCPTWRAHPPALWRLDALWRAWRNLPDDDPDAVCVWWLERADPTMTALTDPAHGPFIGCGPTRHHLPNPLPLAER
jgi:hypothetical protein